MGHGEKKVAIKEGRKYCGQHLAQTSGGEEKNTTNSRKTKSRLLSNWVRWQLAIAVREKYGIELGEENDVDA